MLGTSYVSEHRFDFEGGHCTAYLRRADVGGALFIHTITRMDNGCFIKTDPFEVSRDGDHDSMLRFTAECIPFS